MKLASFESLAAALEAGGARYLRPIDRKIGRTSNSSVPGRTMMSTDDLQTDRIDWTLTTWEGARREQMRRWGRMPLADMIRALGRCRCWQKSL